MSRKTIYFPHSLLFFVVLLVLLGAAVALIFFGAVSIAFSDVGFTSLTIMLLLICTLVGSFINIPLLKLRATIPMIRDEYVTWYGLSYRIPWVEYGQTITVVAVNVGGALIPTAVSIYLLSKSSFSLIVLSLIGVLAVALVTHSVARPVKGVGIATPVFIPPIAAAVLAFLLSPGEPRTVAYVAGTLGTLIGADLLNLKKIPKLGAPVASIGGAGTFDGVFLTGIIAVLITRL
ncbi:MAG: DUF1614 domain-containing protein [Candidatus Bathyarchaeia archaeon]